jgi:formylglycine-generating enzyme required for sulfatase activity
MHRYLSQHGIQPWLDQVDLLPGQNWELEIPKALFSSDVILVCLSKNSINKEGYVQKEIVFALDKAMEKPEGTIFIIPVKLEDCEVPKRLSPYQWVDYYRPDGRKRLLMGLNMRATGLEDVSPVIMEDTRQRRSTPRPVSKLEEKLVPEKQREAVILPLPKEVVKEEPKEEEIDRGSSDALSDEAISKGGEKQLPKKPFTKLLTPSSLLPNQKEDGKSGEVADESERERILQTGREARDKANRERYERSTEKLAKRELTRRKREELVDKVFKFFSSNSRTFTISGITLVGSICLLFGGYYLSQIIPFATEVPIVTSSSTQQPPTPTKTKILATSTITPVPPTPTPTLGIGSTMVSEKDGMVMVYIPAGEFTMGSDSGDVDEKPIHQVYLDAYWIDQTEVTNAKYALCVQSTKCVEPSEVAYYSNPTYIDYPVVNVSWDYANAYCEWAGRRLPTEAEWEKSARGTDQRVYPWGNEFACLNGNFFDKYVFNEIESYLVPFHGCDGFYNTSPVVAFPAGKSPYGAFDMAGNVWEWVKDWYDETYYQKSPSRNSLGPDSGQYRVLRGGSWSNFGFDARSSNRSKYVSSTTKNILGFRCALSP